MLKRLAIKYWPMILFVLLIAAILGMSRYAENRKADHPDDSQASRPQASISPSDADHSASKADKPHHSPDWIDTFTWPDGVTTWALLFTLIVIAWQSTETRDAARGAEKAADAALLNVKAFINSERPWISVKVEPTPWGRGFNVVAVNKGRTPAMILSHAENCIVMDAMEYAREFLPIPPQYGKPVVELETVLPEDSTEVYEITRKSITKAGYSETDVTKLESSSSVAYIFGVIAYRDVLGTPSEVTYETRWCCWLIPDSTPDGVMVSLSTQEGYTGHT